MIPFYAFRDFLLFHSTTNLASCRHWEKVGFPDFSKICKLCKIPELLWLQPKISYQEDCVPPAIQGLTRVHEDFLIIRYFYNFVMH